MRPRDPRTVTPTASPARAAVGVLGLLAALAVAGPAAGQTLAGQVIDHEREAPIEGVQLRLLDRDGDVVATTLSDSGGWFRLVAPSAGAWRIAAELIGYGLTRSDPIRLEAGEVVSLEIRLAVDPVEIEDPIVVAGERSRMSADIRLFHERRLRGERTGLGHFIHGAALERGGGTRASDLLRMIPGVSLSPEPRGPGQVVRMRNGCVPALYIDGSQVNQVIRNSSLDSYVTASSIAGIEVYQGLQQPAGSYYDRTGCGLVLVWTRRGTSEPGPPFSWGRLAIVTGVLAAIVLLFR